MVFDGELFFFGVDALLCNGVHPTVQKFTEVKQGLSARLGKRLPQASRSLLRLMAVKYKTSESLVDFSSPPSYFTKA